MNTTRFLKPEHIVQELDIRGAMQIADFGSGGGHFVLLCAKRLAEGGKVYAFDIQQSMLEIVRSQARITHLYNIETLWTDLEEPNATHLEHNAIDLVIMSNILFQLENKKAVMTEAFRVLKERGRALVIDWDQTPDPLGPPAEKLIPKESVKLQMVEAGFQLTRELPGGSHHYALLFSKP